MTRRRKVGLGILGFGAFLAIFIFCGSRSISSRAEAYTIYDLDQVPKRTWAIVPGAMVYGNIPSPALADRLDAAKELYDHGLVEKIYVSGDGKSGEDEAMYTYLVKAGVPPAVIVRDGVGYRTRTTMSDAADLGIKDAVICTQEFHLARSIVWARHDDIDAVGFVADKRWRDHQTKARLREAIARTVALVELWTDA